MITPKQLRRGLWAITGLAVLVFVRARQRIPADGTATSGSSLPAAPPLADAADWSLTDQRAASFTAADLVGAPSLLVFGFTHCPDVCPTSLSYVADLLKRLGPQGDALRPVFLTVDPERDSVAVMGEYVALFDPRIRGVTGSPNEVSKALKDLGAFSRKVPRDGGDYSMDHTATMLLLDATGRLQSTLDLHESPVTAVAKVRRVLGHAAQPI